jgi:hypothetical protein
MLKERAASAIKHGLPVPTPAPTRARVPDVVRSRSPGAPPSGSREPAPHERRMPLAVKLLGGGLLLLGVIYGLTLFRDHRSEPEATQPPAETDTPVATNPAPVPALAASDSQSKSPAPALVDTASASLAASLPNVAPSLLGAALRVPSARPPQPATGAAKPTKAAPTARKISNGSASVGSAVAPSTGAAPAALPVAPAPTPIAPATPAPAD